MQVARFRRLSVAFCWEFVQNLPLVTGFLLAVNFWQDSKIVSIACLVLGSLIGAWAIYLTESRIVQEHREPPRVVVTNIVLMAVLMFLAVLYFSQSWPSWQTDLLLGLVIGFVLASAQSLAAGEKIGLRHCVALACAISLAMVGLRLFILPLPIWSGILILTSFLTLVITVWDYAD